MGTLRLAVAFGAGLIGVAYLVLWIAPLAAGRIEVSPTAISIDQAESGGFPDAWRLTVTDGRVVFSEARAVLTGRKGADRELFLLTAPVVSASQWEAWRASAEQGRPIDASGLRLVASFSADHVARLWPDVKQKAEAGQTLDRPPVQMTVSGDTEPARNQIYKPMQSGMRKTGLDWEKVRWLRFERHGLGLGANLEKLAIAVGLLLLSGVVFRYHRKRPDRPAEDVLDVTPLFTDD